MDNPCGFSRDSFLAILDRCGPALTAREIAAIGHVSIKQVLCAANHDWWTILPVAWDGPSWKYTRRPVISKTARMPKEVGVYNDQGCTKSGPRGHIVTG